MASTVLLERAQEKTQKRSYAVMGKSQKFSKGVSSSFVPDYRHAVETVGESEGLGSSFRADSEGSCGPKRKCISLNKGGGDMFDIPLKVYSFSAMSTSQRKELESQLRMELEQVRAFEKKLETRSVGMASTSGVTLSSRNGVEKKVRPESAAIMNGGLSGRFDSTKRPQPLRSTMGESVMMVMKQCESLLDKLMKHPFGWVFNNPVDVVALKIPDYNTVIKHPMDFGTIKNKISTGAYKSPWGFVADVRLTLTNAMTYNPRGNDVHIMADKLSKFFEPKWKPIERKLSLLDSSVRRETEHANSFIKSKKRKTSPMNHQHTITQEVVKPRVMPGVRADLGERLASMIEDLPENVIEFLRTHNKVVNEEGEEEIEVDIDALSDDKLLELKRLLDDCSQIRHKQAKAQPSIVEIMSEPAVSMSSTHLCKENEAIADEDVDIGGNEPPISSYPSVDIGTDLAHKSSKCTSSSTSSSDSSSSSGSDSGSSSGSESDVKGASPAKIIEDNSRPDNAMGQDMRNDLLDMNRSLSVGDNQDHDTHREPVTVEADAQQEGENAPSERQVSPDKLYRAALLRSRFADTILKAREKALDQSEKGDPEKLRREKEELERVKREEKARIQAEAKAAEDARRRAELEALAEAKRKREREREAARQSLLQMEKTVEINENSRILKDLEMLRTVPGGCEPNCTDETSPDHSQDGMGVFKFGGSNPLEQLGLFMKDDDEEEEEVELGSAPANDTEEGEID